jgi:P-type Mg2+ transporter
LLSPQVIAAIVIILVTVSLPYTPLGAIFSFKPLSLIFILALAAIIVIYIAMIELAKKIFYKRNSY